MESAVPVIGCSSELHLIGWSGMSEVLSVPALRASRSDQARATEAAVELAPRLGSEPHDLELKAIAAAIVSGLVVALEHWAEHGGHMAEHID